MIAHRECGPFAVYRRDLRARALGVLVICTVLSAGAFANGAYDLQEVPVGPGKAHEIFHWEAQPRLVTDKYLVYLAEQWEAGLTESMARTAHAQNPTTGWLQGPRAKIVARQAPLAISASGREAWAEIIDSSWVECVNREMSPDLQRLLANGSRDPTDDTDPVVLEVHQYMEGGWIEPGRESAEGAALKAICERAGIGFRLSELPESTSRGAPLCYPNWGKYSLECQAERGDPAAQYHLGLQRHSGHCDRVESNAKGVAWYEQSALQGYAPAEERLGHIYFTGKCVATDIARGIMWFRRAAEHGNGRAQSQLADIYREGRGVPPDPQEAAKWSEMKAQTAEEGPNKDEVQPPNSSQSRPAVESTEFPVLRRQAEAGDAHAQFELGIRYDDPRKRDPERDAEAQKWLRRAADQGYARAETRLGLIYYLGHGVPKDLGEAMRWYRRGAEHGDPEAMTRLGHMYEFGEGVPRDAALAHKWINQGSSIAMRPARRREYLGIAGIFLILLLYGASLRWLFQNKLAGWRRAVATIIVHIGGVALVLNTLNTYGLPELLFPHCSYGFLAASCFDYKDLGVRHLAESLHNLQTVNLIYRFMAGIGLVLDFLAISYVVYVVRRMRSLRRSDANSGSSR